MSNTYQHISSKCEQDALILTIESARVTDYDLAEAMGKELIAALGQDQASGVVVDMHKIAFMSSVGYGPFISLRIRCKEDGKRLILCNMSNMLKEMFETTRLLINPQSPKSLFEFAETVEGALEMLTNH